MATTHTINHHDSANESLTGTLNLMAVGRLILAVTSLITPRLFARILGVRPSAELAYTTRLYGARALVTGLGYLTADATERARWNRFSLAVDTIDTASGITHLIRRDVPLRAAATMILLTGSYAAIGAAKVTSDQ